ncbi:translation initiation factor IF-2 N-terminal domain-containing protein, partial [Bacillus velezensis]
MSKKRLYEIAKELGKSSKEVVEYAQELGLAVKSHSSSVEESDVKRIVAKFSDKPQSTPAKPKVEKASEKTVAQAPKATPATPAKPQSRNFKAEREARAKAEAERRANVVDKKRRNDQRRDD